MSRAEWEALAPRWLWRVIPGMNFHDYVEHDEHIRWDWMLFTAYYRR